MSDYILGFDIGGTKCAVLLACVRNGIRIISRECFPTEVGFEPTKAKLFETAHNLLRKEKVDFLRAIGISCGGPLDSHRGIIYSPPHLPGWDAIPITDLVVAEFGVPAYLQNDANACALVEWKLGAGKGMRNMVFLTMGTGIGAGIIAENCLIEGVNGQAGEIGHLRLESGGQEGYGKYGSVEAYCCGDGIVNLARMQKQAPWLDSECLSAKNIADYALNGDKHALYVFEKAGEYLGRALSILVDLLNPECIIIGSLFVRYEKLLRKAMEQVLKSEALPDSLRDCRVIAAKTGEEVGDYASIMAACYALELDVTPKDNSLKPGIEMYYNRLIKKHPQLINLPIEDAFTMLKQVYSRGGKTLICGNGGSAADAEHIVGELMKGFLLPRKANNPALAHIEGLQGALPAIALTGHTALSTAFANDVNPNLVFAQQVYGYGRPGDALICISTSGNAENVIMAAKTAKALGVNVIGMTGATGGKLAEYCDVLLNVPETKTADVQELHLPLYHCLCAMLEEEFFGD